MDEIKRDFVDNLTEKRLINHVCPVSKPKEATSKQLAKMDGE